MKQILTIAALLLSLSVFAQDGAPAKFKVTKYSFGKIKQGVPVTTSFTFTNTGTKPLIIENAEAGCGCTTPEYPKAPVLAGKTGTIKVTYNAASAGPFTKNVNVKFAGTQLPVTLLIEGEVVAAKQ
ncbi:MAG TPA: DUF1573 domain-containing protein [Chitinophagaceae bacterium]|jgi:hypothetical protein|nr:DUF1573 domain-containing protein [Chitinophagaceae bacterium]